MFYSKLICTLILITHVTSQVSKARVILSHGNVSGEINLTQTSDGLYYNGTVRGLSIGYHGIHMHESGNLTISGCDGAKGHYNPFKRNHGSRCDADRHLGDLGNIYALPNGMALVQIVDFRTNLNGPYSILNRAIVVHQNRDDEGRGGLADSLINGHSGARVGCGVITKVN